jgi:hypothetical protein
VGTIQSKLATIEDNPSDSNHGVTHGFPPTATGDGAREIPRTAELS